MSMYFSQEMWNYIQMDTNGVVNLWQLLVDKGGWTRYDYIVMVYLGGFCAFFEQNDPIGIYIDNAENPSEFRI